MLEYNVDEANHNLNISYEYYWDDGNYFNPPETDLVILEVTLNGMDITDFYWDWVDDAIHSQVWDFAQECVGCSKNLSFLGIVRVLILFFSRRRQGFIRRSYRFQSCLIVLYRKIALWDIFHFHAVFSSHEFE